MLAAMLVSALGCAPVHEPGVLLLVVDTMRADAMGDAPDGARAYTEARSAGACTWPSTATLLSGQWPTVHGIQRCPGRKTVPLLGRSILREYPSTAATDSGAVVAAHMTRGAADASPPRRAGLTCDGSPWMASVVDDWDGQGLLYVHGLGAHGPWDGLEGEDYASRHEDIDHGTKWDAAYLAGYAACAAEARRNLDRALALLPPGALAIVTSDHGEALGEDGLHGHGTSLHDAQTHVPLWVLGDGVDPGADETPVGATAVAATVRAALSGDDGCDLRTGADRCDAPVSGMLVGDIWEERL